MGIRIRTVNGVTVALCAAKCEAKPGDLYLDGYTHHALMTKIGLDFVSEGLLVSYPADSELVNVMRTEEQ